MSLFHVLLAVGFPLGLIGTVWVGALEHCRRLAMLVIEMAIPLLFVCPSNCVVLARRYWALRRACVRFLVLPISTSAQ